MLTRETLNTMYNIQNASMMDIARILGCSQHKVVYWMNKHQIKRRSISDAIYQKHNPSGDPFVIKPIKTKKEAMLLGLGLGLYWGEGNKSNMYSVRLGNTDPELIKTFMKFLTDLFDAKKEKMRFSLQIFSDINPEKALDFWINHLNVSPIQFCKVIITKSGSIGTYRNKSVYGVLTIHFHNKKLRDIINGMLPR
ncbi:MAG TPA: hypothetical protein VMR51_00330 [Patescibacteria group bacterium]|nr:hypothetical protein [Patescibacteria group bacterium]